MEEPGMGWGGGRWRRRGWRMREEMEGEGCGGQGGLSVTSWRQRQCMGTSPYHCLLIKNHCSLSMLRVLLGNS